MQCLIKDSEYRTKLAQSGIPESEFYPFANVFVAEHGRFPNLDEIPRADSRPYLKETLSLNESGVTTIDTILTNTQSSSIEEATVKLNDTHADLEVSILPLTTEAIVTVNQRPSEYLIREPQQVEVSPNMSVVYGNMFEKLKSLYGIKMIPITDYELSKMNIPNAQNSSAFIYNGDIYINTDNARADAPIHELTHLLLGQVRFKNPDLYFSLVQQAEQFPDFYRRAQQYPNRTKSDVLEEVFVEEVGKYLARLDNQIDNLDQNIQYELHYGIKRLLDSALMGNYSVKSADNSQIYNMTLEELTKAVQSTIMQPFQLGSLSDSEVHRMLSNTKSELMKKGELVEEC